MAQEKEALLKNITALQQEVEIKGQALEVSYTIEKKEKSKLHNKKEKRGKEKKKAIAQ